MIFAVAVADYISRLTGGFWSLADADVPAVRDVRDGVSYDGGALTGTLALPSATEVKLNVGYGADGTEFVGTYGFPDITMPAPTVLEAVRAYLMNQSNLIAHLSTYDFGDGAVPSVFTTDPIPEDLEITPDNYAVVLTLIGGTRWGTRDKKGAETAIDIRIFGARERSTAALRAAAWAAWVSLERATLSIAHYEEVGCLAEAPEQGVDTDGYPFYRIRVTVRILEE